MEPRGDEGDDAMLEAAMAELSAHEQHDSNNSSPDAPKAQHDLDWDEVQRRHDAAIAEARAALGRGPRSANDDTNNRATGSNAVCNKSSAPAATPPKAHATKLSAGVGPKSGSASKSTKPSSADRVLSGGKSHAGDSSQSTKAVEVALEHEAAPTTAARSLDLHEAAPLEPRVSSGTAVECGKNGNSNDSGIDHHSDQEEGADEDDEDDDVAAADRFDEERYGPPARRGPTFDGVPLSRSAVGNADDSHGEGGGHEDVVEGDASSPVGPRYDETLPDGGYVRRRRRSVMEGDELPPEKKDEGMAQACKEEGNRHFGAGDYDTAAACYTEAMRYAPSDVSYDAQRAVLYANRAACHLQQSKHGEALYDCDRSLEFNPAYVKAIGRRASALERLGKLDEAIRDLERWGELEPANRQAKEQLEKVKKALAERDEKLKAEMLGKLKELGNTILGKFGLSIDNFKAVQDPATGSYSISFQK